MMTDREHIKCLWLFLLGAAAGYLIVCALYFTALVEAL